MVNAAVESASVVSVPPDQPPDGPSPERDEPAEVDRYSVEPLGESYRNYRWIKPLDVEWAQYCNRILIEHGALRSQYVYDSRYKARWRARYLMRLWGDLGIHARWELREHVDRFDGGFIWTIEYLGRAG